METLRKNTKHVSVGDYEFDIAINRQIVLDGFKRFPNLWAVITKSSKYQLDVEKMEDISALADLLDANDIIEETMPQFVEYVFPKMVALANTDLDCDKFLSYIDENGVSDQFDQAIFEFAMLGFTGDKSEKKAKVKFSLK